jgi:hypothetical protein
MINDNAHAKFDSSLTSNSSITAPNNLYLSMRMHTLLNHPSHPSNLSNLTRFQICHHQDMIGLDFDRHQSGSRWMWRSSTGSRSIRPIRLILRALPRAYLNTYLVELYAHAVILQTTVLHSNKYRYCLPSRTNT